MPLHPRKMQHFICVGMQDDRNIGNKTFACAEFILYLVNTHSPTVAFPNRWGKHLINYGDINIQCKQLPLQIADKVTENA